MAGGNSVGWFRHSALLLSACLLATGVCGCGTRDGLGEVTGTVTLDGQPLAGAAVEFIPEKGKVSYGRTDDSGHYSMMFSRTATGAVVGKNKVRITTYELTDRGDGKIEASPERVPTKYNSATELEVDVTGNGDTFDFDLKTEGGKVTQPKQGAD